MKFLNVLIVITVLSVVGCTTKAELKPIEVPNIQKMDSEERLKNIGYDSKVELKPIKVPNIQKMDSEERLDNNIAPLKLLRRAIEPDESEKQIVKLKKINGFNGLTMEISPLSDRPPYQILHSTQKKIMYNVNEDIEELMNESKLW